MFPETVTVPVEIVITVVLEPAVVPPRAIDEHNKVAESKNGIRGYAYIESIEYA